MRFSSYFVSILHIVTATCQRMLNVFTIIMELNMIN